MTLPQVALSRILNDDYVAVPAADQRRSEARLLQRGPWQGREVEFELFNGHYLGIRDRLRPDQPERVLNLAYLRAQPDYQRGDLLVRSRSVAMAGAMLLLVSALFQPSALPLVALAVLCLLALAAMSARPGRWLFSTALGAIPVCHISHRLWAPAEIEAFVSVISERIEGAQVVLPKGSRRLAAELAEHRRMLESGTLSRRHYESARERLLGRLKTGGAGSNAQLA